MIDDAGIRALVADLPRDLRQDQRVQRLVEELLATRRQVAAYKPRSPGPPSADAVRAWIRAELPKHQHLASRVGDQLAVALEPRHELDGDGNLVTIPADVTPAGTPSRDWIRAWRTYQTAIHGAVGAEHEGERIKLLARRAGMDTLTDEEYERELIELGREAVQAISDGEWRAEGVRRGLLPAAKPELAGPLSIGISDVRLPDGGNPHPSLGVGLRCEARIDGAWMPAVISKVIVWHPADECRVEVEFSSDSNAENK